MKLSAQDHSVHIDIDIIVVDKPVTVMVPCDSNVNVTFDGEIQESLKDEIAWLYSNTEIGFGMKIRFYKKHLDMMITQSNGLTSEADTDGYDKYGHGTVCTCIALVHRAIHGKGC